MKTLLLILMLFVSLSYGQDNGKNAHKFRLANGKGSSTRLAVIQSDGSIHWVENGTEGWYMRIISGIPQFFQGASVSKFTAGNFSPLFTTTVTDSLTTPRLTFSPIAQNQNLFFASPNGSAGTPTFRAINNTDLPTSGATAGSYTLSSVTVNDRGIITGISSGTPSSYTLPTASTTVLGGVKIDGTSVTINGSGVISAPNTGGGTVTAVTGNAPITSTGGNAPAIGITAATTSAAGSMSSSDKIKLDGIATNADYYGGWGLYTSGGGYGLIGSGVGVTLNAGSNMTLSRTGNSITYNAVPYANLTYSSSVSNGVVNSDVGTDATIPLADGSIAGLMSPTQVAKLAGIQTNATVYNGWCMYVNGTNSSCLGSSQSYNLKSGTGISLNGSTPYEVTISATNSGTVTSVAASVPTGLSISGSPITSSGTLAFTLTSGYEIPQSSVLMKNNQNNNCGSYTITAGNFIGSSDRRLKKDITALSNLEWVDKIQLVSFRMKANDYNRLRYGVIAQDVNKVAPQLVYETKGELSVAYIDLLIAKIARLEERIKILENEK